MRYCIQPATSADVAFLAMAVDPNSADWGGGNEVDQARSVLHTCARSTQIWVARDSAGVPQALWGVTPRPGNLEVGCLWLLACEHFGDAPHEFRDLSSLVLDEMLSEYPRLENLVDVNRASAIELLRSIGFTVERAVTQLESGQACRLVWLEADGLYSVNALHAMPAATRPALLN